MGIPSRSTVSWNMFDHPTYARQLQAFQTRATHLGNKFSCVTKSAVADNIVSVGLGDIQYGRARHRNTHRRELEAERLIIKAHPFHGARHIAG